jgi:hypothetical protein
MDDNVFDDCDLGDDYSEICLVQAQLREWRRTFDISSIDKQQIIELHTKALHQLSSLTIEFPLLLFKKKCSGDTFNWILEFFDDEQINNRLISVVSEMDLTLKQAESCLIIISAGCRDANTRIQPFLDFLNICSNSTFQRYCEGELNESFNSIVTEIMHRYLKDKNVKQGIFEGKCFLTNCFLVMNVLETSIPNLVRPVMVSVLNQILEQDINDTNELSLPLALYTMQESVTLMTMNGINFERIMELFNMSCLQYDLKSYCCGALESSNFMRNESISDNVKTGLLHEVLNCAKSENEQLRSSAYQLIVKNTIIITHNKSEIETLILERMKCNPPEYEISDNFIQLVLKFVQEKYPISETVSQTQLQEREGLLLPLIANTKAQQLNSFAIFTIIFSLVRTQEEITPCFVQGLHYCIDYLLNYFSLDELEETEFDDFDSLRGALSGIAASSLTEYSLDWMCSADGRDRIHSVLDNIIMCKPSEFNYEFLTTGFVIVNRLFCLDKWRTLLLRDKENSCEFAIRLLTMISESLQFKLDNIETIAETSIDSRSVANFLCRSNLSQMDKEQISKSVDLHALYQLVVKVLDEDEADNISSFLLIQLFHLDRTNISPMISKLLIQLLYRSLEDYTLHESNEEYYTSVFSLLTMLDYFKQHFNIRYPKDILREVEQLCDEVMLLEMNNMQGISSRFERLKCSS